MATSSDAQVGELEYITDNEDLNETSSTGDSPKKQRRGKSSESTKKPKLCELSAEDAARRRDARNKCERRRMKIIKTIRSDKSFVHLGNQQKRWDKMRRYMGLQNDEEMAKVLLDVFSKYCKIVKLVAGPAEEQQDINESDIHEDMSSKIQPDKEHGQFVSAVCEQLIDDEDMMEDGRELMHRNNTSR